MWVDIMRLLRDDEGGSLLDEDILLKYSLRTSRDNKGGLALIANRGIAIAEDADLTIAEAKGRL